MTLVYYIHIFFIHVLKKRSALVWNCVSPSWELNASSSATLWQQSGLHFLSHETLKTGLYCFQELNLYWNYWDRLTFSPWQASWISAYIFLKKKFQWSLKFNSVIRTDLSLKVFLFSWNTIHSPNLHTQFLHFLKIALSYFPSFVASANCLLGERQLVQCCTVWAPSSSFQQC